MNLIKSVGIDEYVNNTVTVKFCPIASSSKGNCTFVSTNNTRVLVDMGLTGKALEQQLSLINEKTENIDAIFITHEHSDHIKGIGVVSRKYDIPIYATELTWQYILENNKIGEIKRHNINYVYEEQPIVVNDIIVKAFEIPHDAVQPVGYTFMVNDMKIGVATDMGHITQTVYDNLLNCNILLIESNHDEDMLRAGSYPYPLKQRVLSSVGHLCNNHCGEVLTDLIDDNMTHIFLGHLSDENNTPKTAYDTVRDVLDSNNVNMKRVNLQVIGKSTEIQKLLVEHTISLQNI